MQGNIYCPFSGAVSEGGHHVAPPLGHCPAVLLPRAMEPGAVRVNGEHLLQVLKHAIKESPAEGPVLKRSLLSVHRFSVGLEVSVEVSVLVSLILGVKVVSLLLTESVSVFKNVVKVKGLVVLVEVVVASSSSMTLSWQRAVAKLVILSPPLIIR